MSRRTRKRSRSFDPGRLVASAAISFGLLALVLSFYNPISGASQPSVPAESLQPEALPELQEQIQTSQLKPASADGSASASSSQSTSPPKVAPTPRTAPVIRTAAPIDALPASKVKAVTTGGAVRSSSSASTSTASYTGPLSVALVALGGDAAATVASNASGLLQASGRDVTVTGPDEVGRTDVLLVLDSLGASVQAWYCQPGPAGSTALAKQLLDGLPPPTEDAAAPDEELAAAFDCEDVHAGRAQTAAVLLEISDREDLNLDETAEVISDAINRYLDTNDKSLRQARAKTSFIWPAIGPITSYFGPSHPLGIDIGEMEGNIIAAQDGKVFFAGGDPCCSYGLYVVIEHTNGFYTVYGHLSSLSVRTGQGVKQGQVLGPVGCTGHCTGNHLHFELWKNGVRIDPMLYLP
ncbi:MAG: M23 family metallopeptidase [Dehalococcoidia bacterium]